MVGEEEGSLSEPLLGGDVNNNDDDEGGSGQAGGFDLLGIIAEFFVNIFVSMGLCSRPPPPLTEAQKLRLAKLASRASVTYDPQVESHVNLLRQLWSLAFPNRSLPSLKCEEWKEMGWQGTDPATDFRSGGLMSLENLAWFAEHQPRVFQRLMHKRDGVRSQWEYPFAAAGVNITFQLVDVLELRDKTKKFGTSDSSSNDSGGGEGGRGGLLPIPAPTSPAGVAFVDCLMMEGDDDDDDDDKQKDDDDASFEKIYVAWFEVLDRNWLEAKATYMEFSQVMEKTKMEVMRALERAGRRRGGCTIAGFRQELGLQ